jgi:uncharacterized surface protein with fasciclin (FAS1) repeats
MHSPVSKIFVALIATLGVAFAANAGHHESDKKGDIVDVAVSAGQFNTLAAALEAADLVDTLKGDGPFTVFAPTDEAFAALPAGTIETLLKPENKATLAAILKFHVLAGEVGSSALADGIQVDTLAQVPAAISQTEGGFNIENARIVATDIKATNGVIHVIDRVILPPEAAGAMTDDVNDATQVINAAIATGVPLFNAGNTDATAAIYEIAARSLVTLADDEALNDAARMRLQQGLERAAHQAQSRQRAWTLRYALDDAIDAMRSDLMQAANR